ncbi:DNA-binding protein [Kouleothrix aurantiaca]|uniref:Manganese transport regulator n=1 Tax=Kouleothrix aurantiaca TaxID=186479 RepID=A0A0P9DD72_9CHLR|nr:DNA-binding protein [Kouleothrix aurantiaca]
MPEASKHSATRRRHGQEGPTEKMREYLEVIYYLSARNEPVIGARLAEWMNVTPPTVTNIVQRMEDQGYIARDGRGEIKFTDEGFAMAEAMVKRHRVLERFLVDVMGIPWHKIHEEAVRLEHSLSPLMEERIASLVGQSTTCPHGNPIPGSGVGYVGNLRLDRAEPGSQFRLRRIVEEAEEDSELMRYLQNAGLTPGASFEVTDQSPSYGVTLRTGQQTITLPPQIAGALWGELA